MYKWRIYPFLCTIMSKYKYSSVAIVYSAVIARFNEDSCSVIMSAFLLSTGTYVYLDRIELFL